MCVLGVSCTLLLMPPWHPSPTVFTEYRIATNITPAKAFHLSQADCNHLKNDANPQDVFRHAFAQLLSTENHKASSKEAEGFLQRALSLYRSFRIASRALFRSSGA